MATPLSAGIQDHKVVTQSEWIESRKELLLKEKEFTKLRDELSRQRRELPWERVEKPYVAIQPFVQRVRRISNPTNAPAMGGIALWDQASTACSIGGRAESA
jgi:hypothetical protein